MCTQDIIIAMGIAFGFTTWPILGKFAKTTGSWTGTIALGTSAIMAAFLFRREFISPPTEKAFIILVIAGIINGIAVYFYAKKATDPEISTAVFLVIVSVFMTVWAPLIDWGLNGAMPNFRQAAGFICAVGAVYLLSK
jgi:drug/metabolite transporter (DMT)-like permease